MIQYTLRRIVFLSVIILLLLGFWYLFGTISFSEAHFVAKPSQLNAESDGQITEILVKQGDFVRKGQVLIKMDSRAQEARLQDAKLLFQALNQAESSSALMTVEEYVQRIEVLQVRVQETRRAEQGGREFLEAQGVVHVQKLLALRALDASESASKPLVKQQAMLAEHGAREALAQAQRDFEVLSRARVQSERDVLRTKQALATLARRQQSVEAQSRLRSQLLTEKQQEKSIAMQVLTAAQAALDAMQIVAPIDGRVTITATKGEYIMPSKVLGQVQPLVPPYIWILASPNPKDVSQLSLNMPVVIRTSGENPTTLMGSINRIKTRMDVVTVRVELIDFSPENILLIQDNVPVSAHVPWWARVQIFFG